MQRFYDTPFGHYGRRMDGLYDLVDPRGSFPEVDRNSTARGDDRNRQSVFSPYESMAWPSTASVGNSMEPNDQYVSGLCYLADYRGSLPEADYNATVHGNNLNGQPVSLPYEHIAESSTASFGNGMYPNANSIVIQYRVPLTAAVPGPEPDFQPYFLERENGQFTRLIPADTLPPLNEVPPREVSTKGHYVLPTLSPRERRVTLKNVEREHKADTVQNRIDRIVGSTPPKKKREKEYCDKWVHDGVCAFTQQGCRYKHIMPLDQKTQHELGLFHGLPTWWRKKQAEEAKNEQSSEAETPPSSSVASSPGNDLARRMAMLRNSPVARGDVKSNAKPANDLGLGEGRYYIRGAFQTAGSPHWSDRSFSDINRRTTIPVGGRGMGIPRSSGPEPNPWGPIQPPKTADTKIPKIKGKAKMHQYP